MLFSIVVTNFFQDFKRNLDKVEVKSSIFQSVTDLIMLSLITFATVVLRLFLGPLHIKQGIKYDWCSVLQLEMCESLWECVGV